MTITYQKFDYNGETRSIVRKKDGNFDVSIPVQPLNKDGEVFNTDYAEYLEWVKAGNTPEESD